MIRGSTTAGSARFPSVLETLAHILAAEWVWLSRWRGESPSGVPGDWDLSSFEGIVAKWDEVAASVWWMSPSKRNR